MTRPCLFHVVGFEIAFVVERIGRLRAQPLDLP